MALCAITHEVAEREIAPTKISFALIKNSVKTLGLDLNVQRLQLQRDNSNSGVVSRRERLRVRSVSTTMSALSLRPTTRTSVVVVVLILLLIWPQRLCGSKRRLGHAPRIGADAACRGVCVADWDAFSDKATQLKCRCCCHLLAGDARSRSEARPACCRFCALGAGRGWMLDICCGATLLRDRLRRRARIGN